MFRLLLMESKWLRSMQISKQIFGFPSKFPFKYQIHDNFFCSSRFLVVQVLWCFYLNWRPANAFYIRVIFVHRPKWKSIRSFGTIISIAFTWTQRICHRSMISSRNPIVYWWYCSIAGTSSKVRQVVRESIWSFVVRIKWAKRRCGCVSHKISI